MKLAYVLGKWDDPATQRRMLAHSLRGEMTEPVVETRRHRQTSMMSSGPQSSGAASADETKALGELLVSADASGLSSLWSKTLFRSMMCTAAEADDVDMLEQLLHIAGHFEVSY